MLKCNNYFSISKQTGMFVFKICKVVLRVLEKEYFCTH